MEFRETSFVSPPKYKINTYFFPCTWLQKKGYLPRAFGKAELGRDGKNLEKHIFSFS